MTTFTLGSSTVVTLPKKLGIHPGQKIRAKKHGSSITLTPTKDIDTKKQLEKDLKLIDKLAGSSKVTTHLTPDEMNRQYDLDTYGSAWEN